VIFTPKAYKGTENNFQINTFKHMIKILCLLYFSFTTLQHSKANCGDSLLMWKSDFKLSWFYFKGEPPEDRGNESAVLSFRLSLKGYTIENLPYYKVYACLNPLQSWAIDTSMALSSFLLMHEKTHFDIAELFARKIRKAVYNLREKNEMNEEVYISTIYLLVDEHDLFQQEYDNQTKLGSDIEKQTQWSNMVENQLVGLAVYEWNPACKDP
jgi:hypothetical protein